MEKEIEDLISKLTDDFEKSISEEEKGREELIEAFKNDMYFAVKTLQETKSKLIEKDTEFIKSVLKGEAKHLIEGDIETKKRELLKDEAFEEIRKTSTKIFEISKNKLDGKEEEHGIDVEAEIKRLKDLLEKVQYYNKQQAKEFVSEALLDSRYITSGKTDVMSFRLYHYEEGKVMMERKRQ